MQLTKTDFIQYLRCPNSLWLAKRDPNNFPDGEFSAFLQKLISEGYLVERYVRQLFESRNDGSSISFQRAFQTDSGLFARADVFEDAQGQFHLYEVKSSTRVKTDREHNHLKDACFQLIASERSGQPIDRVSIIHLDGEYVREGKVAPQDLLAIQDVTDDARALQSETEAEIDAALTLLSQADIDRSSCSCLQLSRTHHCDSFSYFNVGLPTPSIYSLPRLSEKKRLDLLNDGVIDLDHVPDAYPLSPQQSAVLSAAKSKAPVINLDAIRAFLDELVYPLYFLDYETYASAIPLIDGLKPHQHLPFQYSLHILEANGDLRHSEYLADDAQLPSDLIAQLKNDIGETGTVVSWHMTFEKSRNKEMTDWYPEHADFLADLNERMVDLEDLFKTAYVDARFDGYTSIKKVLPVLCPDLSYDSMAVQDGTAAMEAWAKMIDPDASDDEKSKIEDGLRKYCTLDTFAMVEIYRFLKALL
jgi:hypothetical protein